MEGIVAKYAVIITHVGGVAIIVLCAALFMFGMYKFIKYLIETVFLCCEKRVVSDIYDKINKLEFAIYDLRREMHDSRGGN